MSHSAGDIAKELWAAADKIAPDYPTAAALLQDLAAKHTVGRATKRERRQILRACRRMCFFRFQARPAAVQIEMAWKAWEPNGEPPLPATPEYYFAQLAGLGFAPLAWRRIFEEISD